MMTPTGFEHGRIVVRITKPLAQFVDENGLGVVTGAETGFQIGRDPDTVRAPDIAFIRKQRLEGDLPEEAFWPGAPDLAVEVVSPGDRTGEVDERVRSWLDAGAAMVWVVNSQWRSVTVYRSATDIKTLTENDDLDGGDVVPGFRCRVGEIFASL